MPSTLRRPAALPRSSAGDSRVRPEAMPCLRAGPYDGGMDATETTPRSRALGILFAVAVANAVLFLALWGETTGWSGERGGAYLAVAVAFAVSFGVFTLVRDRIP